MNTVINVKKLGFAFGLTGVLLYLGCIIVMATAGHDGTVKFLNSLFHGLDVSTLVRVKMLPLPEALTGVAEIFIISWLTGACIAGFYNLLVIKK